MPRKPTQPYGHVAFGKDGSVRKVVGELPGEKFEQEREVGQNFAAKLSRMFDQHISLEMCEEDNHDFYLNFDHHKVLVQATEIVSRDYLRPLEVDDFVNGCHPYTETVQTATFSPERRLSAGKRT